MRKGPARAFPVDRVLDEVDGELGVVTSAGMTLRDYFAAKALVGLLSGRIESGRNARGAYTADAGEWAAMAFAFADAMLIERDKADA